MCHAVQGASVAEAGAVATETEACAKILNHPPSMGISGIWNNMVNFIHDFGYLGLGYMEFPLIWDILAGTNAFLVSGIVCIRI